MWIDPFQATVKVALVAPDGERLFGATLPVGGEVHPVVRPLPEKLLLGAATVGQTVEGYVVLQAPPGCEFTVESAKADSADTAVEAAAVRAAGRTYRVTQKVAKAGDQSSVVRFAVRTANGEALIVPVEVMYHGEAGKGGGS